MELVIFGQLAPRNPPDLGFPIHYTGHLHDDLSLRALYSAADALVVPSRQEAFGQTASESQACGTPVVAFDIGGLPDIVEHQRTGYLARAFDVEDMAAGIRWVLGANLKQASRERAVARFSNAIVAEQYRSVYDQALSAQCSG
jgi:glycosyltransferase involved in cell wall biosynthesis